MRRGIVMIMACISLIFACGLAHATLAIHAIDAGEGEAMLIITPEGKSVLIDTGNLITGHAVAQFLKARSIKVIDHLIITHPHPDHIGGVFTIVQTFTCYNVYDNGEDINEVKSKQVLFRWYDELVRSRLDYSVLARKEVLTIDGVTFTVLWPPKNKEFEGFNNNSLCMLISYKGFTLLHAGDMTAPAEEKLLALGDELKADVLKVGHHGFHDASSLPFLRAVSPREAVISINLDNVNGYPSPDVLTRLTDCGATIRHTALNGTISFTVADDGTFTTTTAKTASLAA